MSRMRFERAERGQPLPERVISLLSQPQPVRTTRFEHFVGDDQNNEHLRKRYILENNELLRLCSSSRTRPQRDEFLVAYEKPKRRGLYVWEVVCSAHRNQTIQGLVRVEVWSEDAVQSTPASGLTLAVNVRRTQPESDRITLVNNDSGSHYLIIVDMLADEPTISWARNNRLVTQEQYRCDNRSFYLFLLEVEVEQDYEVTTQFRGVCTDPLSLERLCRLVVRNCLSLVGQLDAAVELLPLPVILKDFIQQPDKISDEVS